MSEYEFVFKCTDRGRHQVEILHKSEYDGDVTALSAAQRARLAPTLPGSEFELSCSGCGRNTQIRGLNLAKLYDVYLARLNENTRRVELDISELPF